MSDSEPQPAARAQLAVGSAGIAILVLRVLVVVAPSSPCASRRVDRGQCPRRCGHREPLEPDGTSDQAPTPTEVVSEPRGAVICDENDDTCVPGADYVDCAGTDIGADADVDEPAYDAEPMYGLGADVNGTDCD